MAKVPGRPSKLTPEVKKKLLDAIRAGNYYEPACQYAGISYQTFRNWLERGKQASSGQYFEFFEEVTRAQAEAEVRMIAQWQAQIPEDWKAARDFLARRYPERWAQKESIDMQHSGEVTQRHAGDVTITEQLIADGTFLAAIQQAAESRSDEDSKGSPSRSMGPGSDGGTAVEKTE